MAKKVTEKATGKTEARAPRIAAAQPHGPAATITRRAADRLRAGHLWVYRSDIESLIPPLDATEIAAGALITVTDSRGIPLGTGLYSTASQIAVRIVTTDAAQTRAAYLQQVRERVDAALLLRDELAPESMENDASRLIFSEADALPGIIADRYNDLVILQLLTQGTAQDDVRNILTEAIRERLNPATIIERPDAKIRELEQLEAPSQAPLHSTGEAPQLTTIFTINGLRFHYNAAAGQKPEPSSTNASTTPRPQTTPTAQRSTSAPIREASRFISRSTVIRSQASTPVAQRSK